MLHSAGCLFGTLGSQTHSTSVPYSFGHFESAASAHVPTLSLPCYHPMELYTLEAVGIFLIWLKCYRIESELSRRRS